MENLIEIVSRWTLVLVLLFPIIGSEKILNLNPWLKDFEDCNINVLILEPDLEIGPFDYPISISTLYAPFEKPNRTYENGILVASMSYDIVFAKHVFCAVQVFTFTSVETLVTQPVFGPNGENRVFPNFACSIIRGQSNIYSWTNCVTILAGINSASWNNFTTGFSNEFNGFKYWKVEQGEGMQLAQHFVLLAEETRCKGMDTELHITGFIYLCRICYSWNNSLITSKLIDGETQNFRSQLESTVRNMTGDGRNLLFRVSSYLNSNEAEHPRNSQIPPNERGDQKRKLLHISDLTLRNFYLKLRYTVNYAQVIQNILFENLPNKICRESSSNFGIQGQPPPGLQSDLVTLDKFFLFSFKKNYYLAGTDSFNFITCHGLRTTASIRHYLTPFDSTVWLLLITVLIASIFTTTLTAVLIHNIEFRNIIRFCFYSISTVFENNIGALVPPFKRRATYTYTVKIQFILLSIISIILGNNYKGIITMNIISPAPNQISYEKINDLDGFIFGVLPYPQLKSSKGTTMDTIVNASHNLDLNSFPRSTASDMNVMLSTFGEELGSYFLLGPMILDPGFRFWDSRPYEDYFKRTAIFAFDEQVLEFLSDCSKKRAFVGMTKEIEDFLKFSSAEEFGRGKDSILPVNYYWQIPLAAGSYLHRRMSHIICSGISEMWEKVYYAKTRNEVDISLKTTLVPAQSLHSNFRVLFSLLLYCLGFSSIVYAVELVIGYKILKIRRLPAFFSSCKSK